MHRVSVGVTVSAAERIHSALVSAIRAVSPSSSLRRVSSRNATRHDIGFVASSPSAAFDRMPGWLHRPDHVSRVRLRGRRTVAVGRPPAHLGGPDAAPTGHLAGRSPRHTAVTKPPVTGEGLPVVGPAARPQPRSRRSGPATVIAAHSVSLDDARTSACPSLRPGAAGPMGLFRIDGVVGV